MIFAQDPTAHAEVVALRDAAGQWPATTACRRHPLRHAGTLHHVRRRPWSMPASPGWCSRRRSRRRGGAVPAPCCQAPWYNHRVEWIGGILADESAARLQLFFQQRR